MNPERLACPVCPVDREEHPEFAVIERLLDHEQAVVLIKERVGGRPPLDAGQTLLYCDQHAVRVGELGLDLGPAAPELIAAGYAKEPTLIGYPHGVLPAVALG